MFLKNKKVKTINFKEIELFGISEQLDLERRNMEEYGQLILYRNKEGKKNIEVKLYQDTVWLNQKQLVELFDSSKSNISEHIKHIFEENELDEEIVSQTFPTISTDGKKHNHPSKEAIAKIICREPRETRYLYFNYKHPMFCLFSNENAESIYRYKVIPDNEKIILGGGPIEL